MWYLLYIRYYVTGTKVFEILRKEFAIYVDGYQNIRKLHLSLLIKKKQINKKSEELKMYRKKWNNMFKKKCLSKSW